MRRMKKKLGTVLAVGICLVASRRAPECVWACEDFSIQEEIAREDRDMELQLSMESEVQYREGWGDTSWKEKLSLEGENVQTADMPEEEPFSAETETSSQEKFSDGTKESSEGNLFSSGPELFTSGETDEEEDLPGQGEELPNESEFVLDAQEGDDITESLNLLLAKVKLQATDERPCKVIIPPGSYRLTGTICMYSNIHLYAKDAVITKTSDTKHLLLRLGDTEESAGGYEGYRNIIIEGGTWDCNYEACAEKEEHGGFVGFRIGHAANVTIKDAIFLNNLKSHFVELAGAKNAKVTGCEFRGYWEPYEGGGQECIQIDACLEEIFPDYLPYDSSVCENIVIENNKFEDVFAGVGSHSMVFDRPYKNITIKDNYFKNVKKRGIWCLNYQDSIVENNVMENVGGGIYVRSMYAPNGHVPEGIVPDNSQNQQAENLVIANNSISMAKPQKIGNALWRSFGIQVTGAYLPEIISGIPQGNYIIRGIKVEGNKIQGPGNGLRLNMAENCTVLGNEISLEPVDEYDNLGLYLGASSENKVENNQVNGAESAGIYLYKGSSEARMKSLNNSLSQNVVQKCGEDGIKVEATCNGTNLNANISEYNQGSGFSIYKSEIPVMVKNRADENGKYGFYAYGADFGEQGENSMTSNNALYGMYMSKCRGSVQNLKKITMSPAFSEKTRKIKGTAAGGEMIAFYTRKDMEEIASGKVKNNRYSISVKKQKRGTPLLVTVTDKYKNTMTGRLTVK